MENMFSLKGKTALVIGGSGGIGKGIAISLAKAGANVVVSSRNQHNLDITAEEISSLTGANVIGISSDVTKMDDIKMLIDAVCSKFTNIDILVNSAGLNIRKPVIEVVEDEWDYLMNVQLKSVFFTCKEVAIHMINNKISGKIINLSSLTSIIAPKNITMYSISKGGISQLTKGLAVELSEYGINVNAIGPGYFDTDLTKKILDDEVSYNKIISRIPIGRVGNPATDIGGTAVFLASEESKYITGQTIYVDGGWLIN